MDVSSYSEAPDQALSVVPANPAADSIDSRLDRLRRGFERFRGGEAPEDERSLELVVLLLREENARLKAERYRPNDVGTMIVQMRRMAAEQGEDEFSDEAWNLLSECLVIQEELNQACEEIRSAMSAVQERLGRLAITIQRSNSDLSDRAIQLASSGLPHEVAGATDSELAQIVSNPFGVDVGSSGPSVAA